MESRDDMIELENRREGLTQTGFFDRLRTSWSRFTSHLQLFAAIFAILGTFIAVITYFTNAKVEDKENTIEQLKNTIEQLKNTIEDLKGDIAKKESEKQERATYVKELEEIIVEEGRGREMREIRKLQKQNKLLQNTITVLQKRIDLGIVGESSSQEVVSPITSSLIPLDSNIAINRIDQDSSFLDMDEFGNPISEYRQFIDENNEYINKNYEPVKVFVDGEYSRTHGKASKKVTMKIESNTREFFYAMQVAAALKGLELKICSAYRTYDQQKTMHEKNPQSASPPGYSEHHLGTAVDFLNVSKNDRAYRWLKQNAHLHGFILPYYRDHKKTPGLKPNEYHDDGHWRYVGVESAKSYYQSFSHLY